MELVEVSVLDVVLAYNRWLEHCGVLPHEISGFHDFCHLESLELIERTCSGYLMPGHAAERIRLLTGPHWYAILKAYNAIRNSAEEERHAPPQTA